MSSKTKPKSKVPTDGQWVRRWIRRYGIVQVREGLIRYILDRTSGNEYEALETRLQCGQIALVRATTKQLICELEDWSIGSPDDELTLEEYERVEAFIRPELEGEARPVKEETK